MDRSLSFVISFLVIFSVSFIYLLDSIYLLDFPQTIELMLVSCSTALNMLWVEFIFIIREYLLERS